MTIAAGFHFNGGMLLCADSQFTYGGVSKTQGRKIFLFHLPQIGTRLGFAIAGDIPKAKTAIRNIFVALEDLAGNSKLDLRTVYDVVEAEHKSTYEEVHRHPLYKQNLGPDYNLLIAVNVENIGSTMLSTIGNDVNPVDQYECHGTGIELFRYLLSATYKPGMPLEHIVMVAAHAFEEVKGFDPNVGFNSEFVVFHEGEKSFSAIAGYDIGYLESFGKVLRSAMYDLLFVMADLGQSDEAIQRAKQSFEDNLANVRRRYSEDKDYRHKMKKLFEYLAA